MALVALVEMVEWLIPLKLIGRKEWHLILAGNLYFNDLQNYRIRKVAFNPTCNLSSLNVATTTTNPNISIYPNPAYEQITITANSNITNITITDLLGQAVLTRHISSTTAEINMTGLSPGIYFVTVTNENKNKVVRKIVKQ